jgi:hypothetical protein
MFKSIPSQRNIKCGFCCLNVSTCICVFSYKEAIQQSQKTTLKGYYSFISGMLAVYLVANAVMAVALWQNWKLIEMGCLAPGAVATVSIAYSMFNVRVFDYNTITHFKTIHCYFPVCLQVFRGN